MAARNWFMWLLAREKAAQPSHLRFPRDVVTRSPPQPNLPGGKAHKLHSNGYYARDHRRAVRPLARFGNTHHTPLLPAEKTAPQPIAAPSQPPPAAK